MKLYLKIKEFRQKKGLSQKELASLIGVSAPVITYYETGKKKPNIERAIQIAAALNCTLDDLIDMKAYIDEYHQDLQNKIKKDKI